MAGVARRLKMRRTILLVSLGLILLSTVAFASAQRQDKRKPKPVTPTPMPAKPADAKPTPSKLPMADDQWALLVGISNYPGQIQKLTYASKDARSIKDLLASAARLPEDHIRLL